MRVSRANETDIQSLVALNNRYVAAGLTLQRTEAFAYAHLADYRVIRDADGGVVACAALDEYSPTIVELVSLAVTQDVQGLGYGKSLIAARGEAGEEARVRAAVRRVVLGRAVPLVRVRARGAGGVSGEDRAVRQGG